MDCIACLYSGSDDREYAAHGCPAHTCGEAQAEVTTKPMTISFDFESMGLNDLRLPQELMGILKQAEALMPLLHPLPGRYLRTQDGVVPIIHLDEHGNPVQEKKDLLAKIMDLPKEESDV